MAARKRFGKQGEYDDILKSQGISFASQKEARLWKVIGQPRSEIFVEESSSALAYFLVVLIKYWYDLDTSHHLLFLSNFRRILARTNGLLE
jgi:hypothetical protein